MTNIDIKEEICENWRNQNALKTLVGNPGVSEIFHFGKVPTEKAVVDAVDGIIVRIRTYSGLNWSARSGYGDPFADTDR